MKLVRNLIKQNYENREHFAYYETILDEIEDNQISNPDISIESCKSLVEGISKTILKELDKTYSEKRIEKFDLPQIFRLSFEELAKHNDEIEDEFIKRCCSLIHTIGEIRNRRGDISHGKLAPKAEVSNAAFSLMVMQITESMVNYVLTIFFAIEVKTVVKINYEDNPEFNEMLDEANLFNSLSYSKALFEQDKISYEEQLIEFREIEQVKNSDL